MELKSLTEQKSLLATLPAGKRARLYRLLYEFGPGNGTLMLLPIDQGIEHGPRDFFPNPASKDPDYQFSLAAEAGYSALACQIGMAEKYYPDYAGKVPLILKVNGKTDLPSVCRRSRPATRASKTASGSAPTRSATRSTSARRARTRTSPSCASVREECDRFGMPLVVWSYPRGEAVAAKGGQDSFYAIDYAARMAMEMGADIVKLNMPKINPGEGQGRPGALQRARRSISRRRSASASSRRAGRWSSSPAAPRPTTRSSSATPPR